MAKFLEVGERVYYQPGAPIGVVIDVERNKTLVNYYWGASYWYDFNELIKTCLPLSR